MGLRASGGWASWIVRVSSLAAAYYLAGRLGLLMAIPPGYATAVWPAAGIGLIGILVWGRQVWPAIVLGSFCINLPVSLDALAHGPAIQAWLVAACVSAGAALQAVVGAELVRRWVSYSSLLAREVELIKFLLLAGPVACLVSASIGVFALRSGGVIDASDLLFHWWTWWVGDAIGVLLVLPVFLTWGASPAQLSWQTKLYLSLPLTALCGLVVASFIYASGLEQRRIQSDFARRAEQLTRVLSLNLAGYSDVLESLGDFVASSPELDRQRFATFVARRLQGRPGIQALSWNPLVSDEERAAFEAAARADGNPDYRIIELGPEGRLRLAAHRPSYVAVRYIEPYADNFQALGLDIASSPARRAALLRARISGTSTATGSIILVQDTTSFGFLLALPVYWNALARAPVGQDVRGLRGYAVAAFQIRDLMASFLLGQDTEGVRLSLRDETAPASQRLLFELVPERAPVAGEASDAASNVLADARATAARIESSGNFLQTATLVIGGRNLTLRFSLAPEYLHNQRSWLAWSVLAIGLLFTALLGAFLLVAAGRTALIEETVVRRTSQLRRSHAELEQTRVGLAENEQRLQEAQRIAHVGSWEWDVAGRKVSWSDELYRIHGATPGAFVPGYRTYLRLTHPDDRATLGTAVRQALATQEAFPLEHRIIRPDGSIRMIQSNGRIVADSDGRIVRLLGTAQDVTEFKEIEQRLLQLAHFDPLTSLPNRTLFYQSLGLSLAQAADQGWVISVLLLDIDHFKNVNDTMGHASGDELLRQLGQRLVRTLRVRDTVGRLGGDEFAIILINPDSTHDSATMVADKLREALRQPFDLDGREIAVTASIGIAVYPSDATDADVLLKYADTAMYAAKEAGRDTYRFYTAAMNANVVRRLALDNALRRALEHEEFVLHYQPKLDVASGRWTGVEALLRWNRPGHGLVPPGEFIPLLEETGLIEPVGNWVIDAASAQIAEWIATGIGEVPIAVNVSAKQLLRGHVSNPPGPGEQRTAATVDSSALEQALEMALQAHGIPTQLLEIELTESTLMLHAARTIDLLQRLKARGIRIAIDDFGTGYSSLAYLKRFSVATIKIDQAFIRDINTDADDAAITAAIISMAHNLKLRVIAEGVETVEQLQFLRAHGCDEAQGYLFARPMPGPACGDLLRSLPRLPDATG